MGGRIPAHRGGVLIGDRPADVVMAADVGRPGRGRRLGRDAAQDVGHQARIGGRQRRPDLDHERVVVGEVRHPAGPPAGSQVGGQLVRADDRLGLEQHSRRDDPGAGPQGGHEIVHLGLALTIGALALPHEGDRIEPEDLDPASREGQHDVDELEQDPWIRPVQIPLVGMERGPHPAAIGKLREVARRRGRKDIGQRGLVGVGQRPVGEDPEHRGGLRIAGRRGPGPGVFRRAVIEDEIDAQADAPRAQGASDCLEVVDGAQLAVDRPIVGDRVSAVIVTFPAAQHGHEVEVADPELGQQVEVVEDARQVPGEAIRIADIADHIGRLERVKV